MYRFKQLAEKELERIKNLLLILPKRDKPPKGHVVKYTGKNQTTYTYRYKKMNAKGEQESISINLGDGSGKNAQKVKRAFFLHELTNRLEKNVSVLESVIKRYEQYDYDSVNNSLRGGLSDIAYTGMFNNQLSSKELEEWSRAPYEALPADQDKKHFSMSGDSFRSKSEVIIADTLTSYNIPYRHDARIDLVDASGYKAARYPDFEIMTPQGKTLYWEHLGMLKNKDYANAIGDKLHVYALNGIIPGRNLIISAETADGEIDVREIIELIESRVLKFFK